MHQKLKQNDNLWLRHSLERHFQPRLVPNPPTWLLFLAELSDSVNPPTLALRAAALLPWSKKESTRACEPLGFPASPKIAMALIRNFINIIHVEYNGPGIPVETVWYGRVIQSSPFAGGQSDYLETLRVDWRRSCQKYRLRASWSPFPILKMPEPVGPTNEKRVQVVQTISQPGAGHWTSEGTHLF